LLEDCSVTFDQIFERQLGGTLRRFDTHLRRCLRCIRCLDDRADINDERERLVLADHVTTRRLAVCLSAGDVELEAGTGLCAEEPVVPSLDDLCLAERADREGRAAVVAVVELDAIERPHPDVVDNHGVAGFCDRAVAFGQHGHVEYFDVDAGDIDVGRLVGARFAQRRHFGVRGWSGIA
jgi:hypothetical protein